MSGTATIGKATPDSDLQSMRAGHQGQVTGHERLGYHDGYQQRNGARRFTIPKRPIQLRR